MSQEFSFKLSFDDFDASLLPDGDAGNFATRVSSFFVTQFQGFGGKARVIINDQERVIEVVWTKESARSQIICQCFSRIECRARW